MAPVQIGLCEDDADLRSVLARALRAESFHVRETITGHDAVAAFSDAPPDLLVLDVGLPDADGRDVCQALRGHGVASPVIFLTARDALPDRLAGFNAGGDDYLTKPFALAELMVRVRALLRRSAVATAAGAGRSGWGGTSHPERLRLDPARHGARIGTRSARLTPTEFRLLAALVARPDEVVRRHELVAAAWPDGAIVHDNTLDAYAGRLRRRLASLDATQQLETVRGVGYTLR
ncbi:MAG TPA: response regulator transcription factor [Conexibacter sp.]|jgi:two-component system response regulator MprA